MKFEQKLDMRRGDGWSEYVEGRINRCEREGGIRDSFQIYFCLAD